MSSTPINKGRNIPPGPSRVSSCYHWGSSMQQTGISSTASCSQMEAAGCLPPSLWLLTGTRVMKMETDYSQPDTQITNRDPGEKPVLLELEGDSADLPSAHPHCAPQTWSQVELCSSTSAWQRWQRHRCRYPNPPCTGGP